MAMRVQIRLQETEIFPADWKTVKEDHLGIGESEAHIVYLVLVTVFRSIMQLA